MRWVTAHWRAMHPLNPASLGIGAGLPGLFAAMLVDAVWLQYRQRE